MGPAPPRLHSLDSQLARRRGLGRWNRAGTPPPRRSGWRGSSGMRTRTDAAAPPPCARPLGQLQARSTHSTSGPERRAGRRPQPRPQRGSADEGGARRAGALSRGCAAGTAAACSEHPPPSVVTVAELRRHRAQAFDHGAHCSTRARQDVGAPAHAPARARSRGRVKSATAPPVTRHSMRILENVGRSGGSRVDTHWRSRCRCSPNTSQHVCGGHDSVVFCSNGWCRRQRPRTDHSHFTRFPRNNFPNRGFSCSHPD